jgi:hypothetical protein
VSHIDALRWVQYSGWPFHLRDECLDLDLERRDELPPISLISRVGAPCLLFRDVTWKIIGKDVIE